MTISRRSFLAALAGLPVLGKLMREPEPDDLSDWRVVEEPGEMFVDWSVAPGGYDAPRNVSWGRYRPNTFGIDRRSLERMRLALTKAE